MSGRVFVSTAHAAATTPMMTGAIPHRSPSRRARRPKTIAKMLGTIMSATLGMPTASSIHAGEPPPGSTPITLASALPSTIPRMNPTGIAMTAIHADIRARLPGVRVSGLVF
jgi:hypothetical protein